MYKSFLFKHVNICFVDAAASSYLAYIMGILTSETMIGPISFMLATPRWCIIVWLISCAFFCKEAMGVNGNPFVPIMLIFLELFNSHSFVFSQGRHDSKNPDVMSRFVDKMVSSIFKGVSQTSLSTIKSDTAKFRRIR